MLKPNIDELCDGILDDFETPEERKKERLKKADPINLLSNSEIYEAFVMNRKTIEARLTNEKMVNLIQNGYEEFWDILYKKTKNSIHKTFHKKVHDYYKNTMKEDIYSVMEYGWTKAVLTYDEAKATAPFIAYATYLMTQQYVMLVRKIKENRIGKSVRHEYLESATIDLGPSYNADKRKEFLVQNILTDKSDHFAEQENMILLKQALEALKEEKEDLYDLIILHYIKGMPQTQIAILNNHGQSYISRKIKHAIKFLQDFMLIKSKGNIEELKIDILSNTK